MAARAPTARTVAAAVVAEVAKSEAFAKTVLDAALSRTKLSDADRGLCTELCYGTLRFYRPLEASILRARSKASTRIDRRVMPHLLIAAYQLQHLSERIPARAAIYEAVEAVKQVRRPLAGFANGVLRNLGSAPHEGLHAGSTLKQVAEAYGVPDRLAAAVAPVRGPAQANVSALCARPRLGVVPLPGTDAPTRAHLESVGERFAGIGEGADLFFVDRLDATLRAGLAQPNALMVQDPGSYAVTLMCAVDGARRVLDVCAAPGTKSRGLLARMAPNATLTAVDISARRAARLSAALAHDARARVIVGNAIEALAPEEAPYDVVLVDAPCTGLGTVRRRPEIKLRRDGPDAGLLDMQSALLDAAAARVRPGGTLVYAVCSPLPDEGAMQSAAFLERAGGAFEMVREVPPALLGLASSFTPEGALRILPPVEADTFFAACMRRTGG